MYLRSLVRSTGLYAIEARGVSAAEIGALQNAETAMLCRLLGMNSHTMAHLGFDEEKKKRWRGEAPAPAHEESNGRKRD